MSNTIQNGKGSKRRPGKEISQEEWDEIFKKKKPQEQTESEVKNKELKN